MNYILYEYVLYSLINIEDKILEAILKENDTSAQNYVKFMHQ